MSGASVYDNMRDEFVSGYLQVYTGDGKGKTTAAVGLAVRALGAGINVFFAQFIKGGKYSEIEALESLSASRDGLGELLCRQYGLGCFIMRSPEAEDIAAARDGLDDALREMKRGRYRLVILDEANVAVKLGLLSEEALIAFAKERPRDTELVITGRGAPASLIELADLVTEMREVKHYYQKGILARRGIES
ncbi:MAG: cob(I)yrinic acid a,c-diamide adenosyltransferase [Synergistaceae bacterium]|jgi:cob(I)alamin adenosyltransferase|nr:cob(I)yrinic acid a,c-diamide adenosyltransferase [Synergistaceae bacterium]